MPTDGVYSVKQTAYVVAVEVLQVVDKYMLIEAQDRVYCMKFVDIFKLD